MVFGWLSSGKPKTIEQMLESLSGLGVRLAPDVTPDDLTSEWEREEIEEGRYEMMLIAMGGEIIHREEETEQTKVSSAAYLSHDVWHFDSECVDEQDTYTTIVNRAALLAGGDLRLEGVRSFVDFDSQTAWVEWISRGLTTRHQLKFKDDWADGTLFEKLDRELLAQGSQKQFFNLPLGQDCIFVCCTPERRTALAKLTGLTLRKLV